MDDLIAEGGFSQLTWDDAASNVGANSLWHHVSGWKIFSRKLLIVAFLIVPLSIIPVLGSVTSNIVLQSSGTIVYNSNQVKMLRYVWWGSYYTQPAYMYAIGADIVEGFYPWLYSIDTLEDYNPNVVILQYYDMPFTLGSSDGGVMDSTFMTNGWLLKDAYGNYITPYYWDIGNPSARAWVANWLEQNIVAHPSLDGTRLDDYQPNSDYFGNHYISPNPINPRTGNAWTDQEICDAVIAFTNSLKQVTGKLVFANGIANGYTFWDSSRNSYWTQVFNSNLDGIMSEQLFSSWSTSNWMTEGWWKSSLDYLVWLENNWMVKGGKYEVTIAENAQLDWQGLPSLLPSGVTQQQYMTFCFASELLAAKYNYPCMCATAYTFNADGFYQSLFSQNISQNLGIPSDSYSVLTGTHIYARQFSGGMVLVNPTGSSYTVSIGTGYKNAIDGSVMASTITVQPHIGIILLKV